MSTNKVGPNLNKSYDYEVGIINSEDEKNDQQFARGFTEAVRILIIEARFNFV
jgi:hypothetical protein